MLQEIIDCFGITNNRIDRDAFAKIIKKYGIDYWNSELDMEEDSKKKLIWKKKK